MLAAVKVMRRMYEAQALAQQEPLLAQFLPNPFR